MRSNPSVSSTLTTLSSATPSSATAPSLTAPSSATLSPAIAPSPSSTTALPLTASFLIAPSPTALSSHGGAHQPGNWRPFSKIWQNCAALIASGTALMVIYYTVRTYNLAAWTAKKDYREFCDNAEVFS
ncbi:hypothetical protein N7471_001750 [Penicillium samsonianum]|uniref:uncharacterized protein n=1 Tax=Penicillium samsonianum TaxID=1882272 RepID=UPI002548B7D0|nr:uncharacterized protein N7471_001750 [Penicillium samsonianum]KAJ6150551.1 hypothetical protein N7471_001750 [Penicillium samsonianum]